MAVQFSTAVEYPSYPFDRQGDIGFMVNLEAPPVKDDQRKPLDLVCVLDRSGSMSGSKMELMRAAMMFTVEQLRSADRLCLVTFDTEVAVPFALTHMDTAGKNAAREVLKQMRAGSSTNLSGGLFQGVEMLKSRITAQEVSSLLLFTDGQANHGITEPKQLQQALENVLSTLQCAASIHTFGFGADHNGTMLAALAEIGAGLYNFIGSADEIPPAFANCLGGLLSVAIQNIEITVATIPPSSKPENLNTGYKTQDLGEKLIVRVPDMYGEEKKNLLFTLRVPAMEQPSEAFVISTVLIKYLDTREGQMKEQMFDCVVNRSQSTEGWSAASADPEFDRQRNRVISTAAAAAALKFGAERKLADARNQINQAIERISAAPTASDPFCVSLVGDLRQMLSQFQDHVYSPNTSHSVNCWAQQQCQQRSSHNATPYSSNMYQNMQQQAYVAMSTPVAQAPPPAHPSLPRGYGAGPYLNHYPPSSANITPPNFNVTPASLTAFMNTNNISGPPRGPVPTQQPQQLQQPQQQQLYSPTPVQQMNQQQLASQVQNLRDERTCIICMARERKMLIMPCAHLVACETCSKNIQGQCPVCRGQIAQWVKVHT